LEPKVQKTLASRPLEISVMPSWRAPISGRLQYLFPVPMVAADFL
jgi:hypothetical protein